MTRKSTKKVSSAPKDPLTNIRIGTEHEVADAKAVVAALIDPKAKTITEHYDVACMMFLVGVVLYTLHHAPDGRRATLSDVAWKLTCDAGIDQLYVAMKENEDGPSGESHRTIRASAIDMLELEERARCTILTRAKVTLYPHRN